MVKVNYQIIITGIICLTAMYIAMLAFNQGNTDIIGAMIVGIIGLLTGVIIPSPKIDNRRGVLQW